MVNFFSVLSLLVAAQVSAATYVGSADGGIARGWPQMNSLYESGQSEPVFITLERTEFNNFESRGDLRFNVGYGEGNSGNDFYGRYVRQGNRLYFYFDGKQYSLARGAKLVQRGADLCLSIIMSTSRRPVLLCEGPIGA